MSDSHSYEPEIDYKGNNFLPVGKFRLDEEGKKVTKVNPKGDEEIVKDPPWVDMCGHCEKYYASLFEKGLTKTPFPPNCARHILENIDTLDRNDFSTDEEFVDAHILMDPTAWVEKELNMTPYWYQEWILSCTCDLKLLRAGRRLGKCLVEGTQVLTPKGPVKIEDLSPGDIVYSEYGKEIKVKELFDQGMQDVVDLCNNGTVMASSTLNHPWLVKDSRYGAAHVRKVKDFYKGIKILRKEVSIPLGNVEEKHAYALGALLGDGCSKEGGLVISSADEEVVKKVAGSLNTPYKKIKANNYSWYMSAHSKNDINHYSDWLHNKYAHEKLVELDVVKTWNRHSIKEFLAGLIDTDGSVYFSGKELCINFCSQSKSVIEAVRYCINVLIQKELPIGLDNRKKYVHGPIYYLNLKHIYFSKKLLKELSPHLTCSRKQYKPEYDSLQPNNFSPDSVSVTLKNPRKARCYDIEVDSPTNLYLLANGLVTHNTQAMLMETLHFLFTSKGSTVIMCAPTEKQVTRFFDELSKLIRESNSLQGSISRYIKSPARIEFKNNTKILGFTLNPNQGESASVSVRGQDADLIVVDELDFIADKDIDVLFAIKASHPRCRIIAATTPSGQRRKFYKMIVEKDIGWKEFWFISQESPRFTQKTEEFFRGMFNDAEYQHEVFAEFGEPAEGVFKKQHIEAALQTYDMAQIEPDAWGYYILGVDWNKSHGTHMCILQKTGDNKLKLIRKIIIPEAEYMQTQSVDYIITLHTKWRFKYIFVDAGYGGVQVELLKKHGIENPSTRLHDIVHPITMNQVLSIKDPVSGQDVKKFTKPFMVQQTVKLLEDRCIILPVSEDTAVVDSKKDAGLVQQMRNYRVVSYSIYGLPQYTKEGEHTLVAFMLACGGYIQHEGELASHIQDVPIRGILIDGTTENLPNISQEWTESEYREYMSHMKNKGSPIPSRDVEFKTPFSKKGMESLGNYRRKNSGSSSPRDRSTYRRKSF